jgi:hypothetical protein
MGALAAFLKRGWLDEGPEQRAAFFAEVEAAVASSGDAAIRRVGIQILEVGFLFICCIRIMCISKGNGQSSKQSLL